jgi:cytochrome c oxidase assembly protein subunit 15
MSYGHLLPPFWNPAIAIHFIHRVGALIVTGLVVALVIPIRRQHRSRAELTRPAALLLALVAMQITLGASVVLTGKHPIVNTLHVVTGAMVLATSLVMTLRTYRVRFVEGRTLGIAPAPARA